MNGPKVAFVIHGLSVGGAEVFFVNLVNNLYKKGMRPVIILLSDDNPLYQRIDPNIPCIIIRRRYKYDLSISKKIKKIILDENINTVFCIGAFIFFLARLRLLANRSVRFVLSLHSTEPRSFKELVLETSYLRFFKKTDATVFICRNQQDYYRKMYFFRPKNNFLVYNGVNIDHFNPLVVTSLPNIRENHNISRSDSVILKVAEFRYEKGHRYAVEALSLLHKKHNKKAHLLFVGAYHDQKEEMEQYAASLGVKEFIHMAGVQKDVRPYYMASDMFTLTSFKIETFSLSAIEAMCFGLPCSLTNIGGASEMIADKRIGLLTRPRDPASIANSWNEILETNFDKKYIAEYAIKEFSLQKMVDQYQDILS